MNGPAFWQSSTEKSTTTITLKPEDMFRSTTGKTVSGSALKRGKTLIKVAGKIFSPDDKRFGKGRKALSKKQAELYESVYDRGDSVGEYATDNKIDQSTASKRNSAVIKKFKKIFG